ncbi:MAG: TonB-dependent receptor [Terriglobales bacterium]
MRSIRRPAFVALSFVSCVLGLALSSADAAAPTVVDEASAQTGVASSATKSNATSLEEVVVTAERRKEPLMDVPISVTALTGEQLQALHATDFEDYMGSVAGLSYDYVGPLGYRDQRTVALRGITGVNTIGFYIDDTPVPFVLDPKLLDIERIEVLRGPQATLYGSGSEGGTIKIVTVQPDANKFSGSVEGDASTTSGGDHVNNELAGIVNVPLINDVLAIRASWSRTKNSGFITNYYQPYPGLADNTVPQFGLQYQGVDSAWNNEYAETARIALRFTPNIRLTITPSVFYNTDSIDANAYYYSSLPNFNIQHFFPTPETARFTLSNLTAKYDFDSVSIVNSTSYFLRTYTGLEDITQLFPVGGYHLPAPLGLTSRFAYRVFTEEVHADTKFDGPLNGLVGVIYQNSNQPGSQVSLAPGLSAYSPTVPPVPGDQVFVGAFRDDILERDAYAELRYKVLRRLELTGGVRYYQFHIHDYADTTGLFGSGLADNRSSESGARPRATISWQATDDVLLYSNFARGFRPGGTNLPLPAVCIGNSGAYTGGGYKSDNVNSYDLGVKAALLEHSLNLMVDGYTMDWNELQQNVFLPCGTSVTANTGSATSRGVEIEGAARPTEHLSLNCEGTYAYTKLDSAQLSNNAMQGDPILTIPRWQWGIGAQYDLKVTDRWSGFGRVDYSHEGSAWLNYGARPLAQPFERNAYGTLGLHLGLQDVSWRVEIYGSNLTNAHPITNVYSFGVPQNTAEYSTIRPLTVGLNAIYKIQPGW